MSKFLPNFPHVPWYSRNTFDGQKIVFEFLLVIELLESFRTWYASLYLIQGFLDFLGHFQVKCEVSTTLFGNAVAHTDMLELPTIAFWKA